MQPSAAPVAHKKSLLDRVLAVTDAFAWPLRTSHYLELVNPLWTTHALQARVESVWDETADARTITLKPGRNWRSHRPGQHLRIGVPIGGMHYTRTYSISSAPEREDECFTITVKAIQSGRMSHHLVRQIKPGDFLPIGVPQGDFYLPDANPVQPLFISAGSGITPIMSMLRSLVAQERLPDVTHIHYAPHAYDVIFGQELKALADKHPHYKLHLVYTREPGEDLSEAAKRRKPYFSGEQLEKVCPDWRSRDVWACGPQGLLDAVEGHWREAGLSRQLHTERFRAQVAPTPTEITAGTVRFADSAVEASSDGIINLLRLAEDNGLNPPHGCRMGICHGCDAVLKSGCVRDLRTNAMLNEPGQIVQICVCAAAGDAELAL
ncbi:ferredoxin reductase [Stagnimonas aquatica]|uniref:Ferredoxin reductase n=1 Tax=Stagnimonas aquatica TaxID=2689987 RepID=A0A3N0VDQ8_9GAMM|nr:ferredoxin reductase [Stagnimonas aquatica]ROH90831.1 ferredoxin reductase [Stagnimonas aquatica]